MLQFSTDKKLEESMENRKKGKLLFTCACAHTQSPIQLPYSLAVTFFIDDCLSFKRNWRYVKA